MTHSAPRAAARACLSVLVASLAVGCASSGSPDPAQLPLPEGVPRDAVLPGESHLANVRMLSFGGQNAEAYWSFDDQHLIFQTTRDELGCDQIFIMDVATGDVSQLTDSGRTTCAYFLPDSERVLFASTHEDDEACPPEPDRSMGYVWAVYDGFEIYTAERDGSGLVNISNSPGYDAEATVRRDGRIVFTSDRSGDLELWSMNADGGDLVQLTDEPGYDGGAFYSFDGSRICWRRTRFDSEDEVADYERLLAEGLVRPSKMELWVMNADGTGKRQVTDNGKANFGPFFTPDGGSLLFCSNVASESGYVFDIWMIDLETGALEQITHNGESFDGFPMFSWDGRRLVFASNRYNGAPRETNIFIADWVP